MVHKMAQTFPTKMKRKGERGSSYQIPREGIIFPRRQPLVLTEYLVLVMHPLIHLRQRESKPLACNTTSKNAQSTASITMVWKFIKEG